MQTVTNHRGIQVKTVRFVLLAILSACTSMAFCLNPAFPEIDFELLSAAEEVFTNIRISLGESSQLLLTILFAAFLFAYFETQRVCENNLFYLIVSLLTATVWSVVPSYYNTGGPEWISKSEGQIIKTLIFIVGMTAFLYAVILWFHKLLKEEREGRLFERHCFWKTFLLLLAVWLPHIVICYPASMFVDSWNQLCQVWGLRPLTTHHSAFLTVLIGLFSKISMGLTGSCNVGLFAYAILQCVLMAFAMAYCMSIIVKELEGPEWIRILFLVMLVFCPYFCNYAGLVVKDTPYSCAVAVYCAELIVFLEQREIFFKSKKHMTLYCLSTAAIYLCRNNGKYILVFTVAVLIIVLLCTREMKRILPIAAPVIGSAIVLVFIVTGFCFAKGSRREALSFPMQQTARYLNCYPEEVTDEETEAISKVFDINRFADRYQPMISDPVKETFREEASTEDILNYLKVWLKMSAKKPRCSMEAILIQNFPIIYPFMQNPESTADTVYEEIYFAEAEKLNVTEPEALQPAKQTLMAYYMFLFSAPLVGTLSQQSVYCIGLIILVCFSLHDRLWRFLLAALPAILSLGIIILAPAIQWEPRYAFPIIYSMPLLTAYYSHLIRDKDY